MASCPQLIVVVMQYYDFRKAITNAAESLQPTDFPSYLWQMAAVGLFELKGQKYLLAAGYYLSNVNIEKLSSISSPAIIDLKQCFYVPSILITMFFGTNKTRDLQIAAL